MRSRLIAALPLVAVLGGCGSASIPTPVQIQSTKPLLTTDEAKAAVLANRSKVFKDPDSIKEAKIASAMACTIDQVNGPQWSKVPSSCVCVELNAKNSYGGYTGVKRSVIAFPEVGEPDVLDTGTNGADRYCTDLRPFPELDGGYKPAPKKHG